MKALVYTGVQELTYRDEKDPVEKDGESILKVEASGICGSDIHYYEHGKIGQDVIIIKRLFSS